MATRQPSASGPASLGLSSCPASPPPEADSPSQGSDVQRLKKGSIGLLTVLFIGLANAAPITGMTGNVPIAIGYGNGSHAPGGFLVAMLVLAIFSVGYTAMARHITATGAFYGYISHGLGQAWGMASGLLATMAYVVFEASLVGIFSSVARTTVTNFGGPTISWIVYALVVIAVVAAFGYFDVSLSGHVLGVFLIAELVILLTMAVAVFISGGASGLHPGELNPLAAFTAAPTDVAAGVTGSVGIGLFFAFWSWIGYETTAVYGEESRDPKRIVPRATMIAVIMLGLLFTFVSWMVIAGNGPAQALAVSRGSTGNAFDLFYGATQHYVGGWAKDVYQVLLITGSFACALAFHNAACRYMYALGREGLSRGLSRTVGATHPRHGSPHIASLLQSAITLVITLLFFTLVTPAKGAPDVPYYYQYGLLALLGTLAIFVVQIVCSISVVFYFHVGKRHPETRTWWRTLAAPLIGAVGLTAVAYTLVKNLNFAAGAASGSLVFKATPYLVIGFFLVGLLVAIAVRALDPERYALIGRIVLDDSRERR